MVQKFRSVLAEALGKRKRQSETARTPSQNEKRAGKAAKNAVLAKPLSLPAPYAEASIIHQSDVDTEGVRPSAYHFSYSPLTSVSCSSPETNPYLSGGISSEMRKRTSARESYLVSAPQKKSQMGVKYVQWSETLVPELSEKPWSAQYERERCLILALRKQEKCKSTWYSIFCTLLPVIFFWLILVSGNPFLPRIFRLPAQVSVTDSIVAPSGSTEMLDNMFRDKISDSGARAVHVVLSNFRQVQHSAVETMAPIITNSKEVMLSFKEQVALESSKMLFALKEKIANAKGADNPQTLYAGMLVL